MTFVPTYAIQERAVSENPDAGPQGAGWKEEEAFTLEARHHTQAIAAPLSHGSNPNSNAAGRRREDDENLVVGPLGGGNDGIGRRSEDDPNLVAQGVAFRGREGGIAAELSDVAPSMRSGKGSASRGSHALVGASVRRLTPTECERLQALPDNWTAPAEIGGPPAWAHRLGNRHDRRHGRAVERARLQALRGRPLEFDANKDSVADSKRYAALGDAVTASVAEWIGTRLMVAS